MSIDKNEIDYLSKLAKLKFSEEEEEILIEDLNKIIGYMEKLKEVNTENIEETVHTYFLENNLREDEVKASLDKKEVLKLQGSENEDYFVVPKVISENK